MDNAIYATLSRQVGLERSMQTIANNLANVSTEGFRREGVVFAEWVDRLPTDGGSLSQATAMIRTTDFSQGGLSATKNPLDLALEGEGFFALQTPDGVALTRVGSFKLLPSGELAAHDGARLLDGGGAPIVVPSNASNISIARDGTISVDGLASAQIGVVSVADPLQMSRIGETRFVPDGDLAPAANASVIQGFVEQSNVNAVLEMTRMIDVQRSYEAGQSILQSEDERMREAMRVFGGA